MPALSRRIPRLPAFVFVAAIFALMPLALLGQRTYVAVDMKLYGSPARDVAHLTEPANGVQNDVQEFQGWVASFWRDLRHGTYQKWSPYNSGGVPTGTTPIFGTHSPTNLTYLVLPAWYAATLRAALYFLTAQVGCYLLARRLGISQRAATVAGVAYGFCGANMVFLHRVGAAAVAPLVLWAGHRLFTSPTERNVIALALTLAWSWYEGFPAAFIFNLYAVIAVYLWLTGDEIVRANHRRVALRAQLSRGIALASSVAVAAGLSALTLFGTIEQVRARGYLDLGGRQYNDHSRLANTAMYGMIDLSAIGDWKGQLLNIVNSFEGINLVGSIALLGAAAGLVQVARGRLRISPQLDRLWPLLSVAVAVLITLYYLGTPLLTAMYHVPGLSSNLFHRSRYLCTLFIVLIGAAALDAAWTSSADHVAPSKLARITSGLAAIFLLVIAVRFLPDFVDIVRGLNHKRAVVKGMGIAALFAAASLVLVRSGRNRNRPGHAVALSALLFVQLAIPLRDYNPQASPSLFDPTTTLHEIVQQRAGSNYRYLAPGLFTLYANDAMVHRLFDARGQALQDPDYFRLMERAAPTAGRDPFHVLAYASEFDYASTALDHLAVKLVVLSTNDTPFGRELDPVTRTDVMLGPDRVAGVWLTPRFAAPCSKGFVTVRLVDNNGRSIDEARRPVADASGGRISFALAGTAVRKGDPVRLQVDGPSDCPIELGPELNWIVEDADSPVHIVDTDKGWVYERSSAFELVSAHTAWTSYPTREEAVAGLADHGGGVTVVGDRSASGAGTAVVDSFSFTTNGARAEVHSDVEALILFSMNDDPGWQARVDGRSVPIVVADGALMAVEVEPGNHHIELNYRPGSFRAGVAVTFLTVAGLVVFLSRDRRTRRIHSRST
ncbi:MAG: YfhO family protein [Acidimicrobiales bacterium]